MSDEDFIDSKEEMVIRWEGNGNVDLPDKTSVVSKEQNKIVFLRDKVNKPNFVTRSFNGAAKIISATFKLVAEKIRR